MSTPQSGATVCRDGRRRLHWVAPTAAPPPQRGSNRSRRLSWEHRSAFPLPIRSIFPSRCSAFYYGNVPCAGPATGAGWRQPCGKAEAQRFQCPTLRPAAAALCPGRKAKGRQGDLSAFQPPGDWHLLEKGSEHDNHNLYRPSGNPVPGPLIIGPDGVLEAPTREQSAEIAQAVDKNHLLIFRPTGSSVAHAAAALRQAEPS